MRLSSRGFQIRIKVSSAPPAAEIVKEKVTKKVGQAATGGETDIRTVKVAVRAALIIIDDEKIVAETAGRAALAIMIVLEAKIVVKLEAETAGRVAMIAEKAPPLLPAVMPSKWPAQTNLGLAQTASASQSMMQPWLAQILYSPREATLRSASSGRRSITCQLSYFVIGILFKTPDHNPVKEKFSNFGEIS